MNEHLSSASLKSLAKGQLLGKYGTLIGAYLIHLVCILFIEFWTTLHMDTATIWGILCNYAISFVISLFNGIFLYGEAFMYLKIACNQKASVRDLFYGFTGSTDRILKVQAVLAAISLIGSLPDLFSAFILQNAENPYLLLTFAIALIICTTVSIILNLIFSQAFYLMLDFPQYTPKQILLASHKIMKGNKGRLFYIMLSFLPLYLLGICSCCVTFLWIFPYQQAVNANFYLDLMKKNKTQTQA